MEEEHRKKLWGSKGRVNSMALLWTSRGGSQSTLANSTSRHIWRCGAFSFPLLFREEEAVVKIDQMMSLWPFRQSKVQGIQAEAEHIG